jgi:hypothetical protein
MKNILPFILSGVMLFTLDFSCFSQQVPNFEFENWTGGKPVSWDASNESVVGTTFTTVTQITSGQHSGLSSVKIETLTKNIFILGDVTLPGILTLGEFNLDIASQSGTITGGIIFPHRPSKLKGYYKSEPASGDRCMIAVGLSKLYGSTRDTIGYGEVFFSTAVTTWTPFEIVIDWTNSDIPDSLNIIAASSDLINSIFTNGSKLWIDSLYFEYTLPGFESIENASICQGDIFNWRGDAYTNAGTYYDSLISSQGADSVYVLNLTLLDLPSPFNVTGGGSYPSGGSGVPVDLSGSETGVTYSLFLDGSPISTLNGTGSALSFGDQTAEGTYTVVATNISTGCTQNMTGDAVVIISGISENKNVTGVVIYPNPASHSINILSDTPIISCFLVDAAGRIVSSSEGKTMDVSGIENGIYILKINTAQKTIFSHIIIEK